MQSKLALKGLQGLHKGYSRGYIGTMEKDMETAMVYSGYIGFRVLGSIVPLK